MTGVFAVMNGIVPAIAQDPKFGTGLGADVVSFATLTPYALIGLAFGPVAGILASKFGYLEGFARRYDCYPRRRSARLLCSRSCECMGLGSRICYPRLQLRRYREHYANGLGIVLSPKDNEGYLPGFERWRLSTWVQV